MSGGYQAPLFSCTGWIPSVCCYPCEMGTALEAADGTSYFIGCCLLPPALTFVLGAIAPPLVPISANILQCWMRNQFAQKFGLQTTLIGDAMASVCWPCGMAQVTHELNYQNALRMGRNK